MNKQQGNTTDLIPSKSAEVTRLPEQSIATFERLASNPDVSLEKLQGLMAMQERILALQAKQAFDAAFAQMQGELPSILKQDAAMVGGQVRYRYVNFGDLVTAIRPTLTKHGFSLRFSHEQVDGDIIVTGHLSHEQGHTVTDTFRTPADASGGKQAIQAIGSARAYGQRYTTKALLCIAEHDDDTDGRTVPDRQVQDAPSRQREAPPPPSARATNESEPITDPQRKRLFAISKTAKVTDMEIKVYLKSWFGYTSTSEITRGQYELVCKDVEKGSPLPLRQRQREPGEE